MSARFLRFGPLFFLASIYFSPSHAQEASEQVEQFLDAFRGKPVSSIVNAPESPAGSNHQINLSQAPSATARQYTSVNVSSCPPGVDRIGCSAQQPASSACAAGTTSDPRGCVPTAMPPHAHWISADGSWQCDDGYQRYGPVCVSFGNSHAATAP
ncbi:hypothetical protein bgla_2g16230 [Burkholderia gladioli BSR3]|uniref:Uncharacterized protein n=1 Tax=Burkholderia gladioli (strain BSR3) TaxID=999541 RepID=F2LNA5_BURGS|nr:hypothetical protein bgla_2g16230 [Burkholderia gladioli BSR3]